MKRSDIIDRYHIDDISFSVLVECAHLSFNKKREQREREMYTARFCFLSVLSLSLERKKPNERSSVVGARRERERDREKKKASHRRHRSSHIVLSDLIFSKIFIFFSSCFVYFAERKKKNDVDAEEQRDDIDDD